MGCGPSTEEQFFAAKTDDHEAGAAYRTGGEKDAISTEIGAHFFSTEGEYDLANVREILTRTKLGTAQFLHKVVLHCTHKRDFGYLLAKISPNQELEAIEFDPTRAEAEAMAAAKREAILAVPTPKLPQMARAAAARKAAARAAAAAAATANGGGGPADEGGGSGAAATTEEDPTGNTAVVNATAMEAYRQKKRDRASGAVATIDELYEVAELVDPLFKAAMEEIASTYGGLLGGVTATFPPDGLKAKDRALQRAHTEHNGVLSKLFDIVVMTFDCDTVEEVAGVVAAVKSNSHVLHTIKGKNRCRHPTANGFFDIVMHVCFQFEVGGDIAVEHVCEIHVQLREVAEYAEKSKAYGVSEFFRSFFVGGTDETLRERLVDMENILGGSGGGDSAEDGGRKVVPFLGTIDAATADSKALFEKLVVDVLKSSDLKRLKPAADLFSKHAVENELALLMYKKILVIQSKAYCPDQAAVGTTYHNLANVLVNQGEKRKALGLYNKVLEIRLETLGPEHADCGATYNNIAVVLHSQDKKEEAMDMYEKALAISSKALGNEHVSVGSMYNNIGMVLGSQGAHDKAMVAFGKALAIRLKVLGPEHAEVGNTCYSIAETAANVENFDKALEFYGRAVACYTESFGEDHGETRKAADMVTAMHGRVSAAGPAGPASAGRTRTLV